MCKINANEIRKAIETKGMSISEVSREIGRDSNYIHVALNKGTMAEDMMDKLCFILDADRETLTRIYSDFEQYTLHGETVSESKVRKGKNKNFYTPQEFESLLDTLRVNANEKEMLATAEVSKTKQGNTTTMCVPLSCIHVAPWQRDTRISKAKTIAESYKDWACDKPKTFFKDGKLYVVDGNHRVLAQFMRNAQYLWVEVIEDATESEIIDMFLMQDVRRTKMSSDDMYRASLVNNVTLYKNFRETMMANRIQVKADPVKIEKPNGTMKPTVSMLRLSNSKPYLFDKVLSLVSELEWKGCRGAYSNRTISTLIKLMETHGSDVPTIEEKLKEKCFGAAFYEAYVIPCKSNAMLYDLLVEKTK